jgi:hypothetical protein
MLLSCGKHPAEQAPVAQRGDTGPEIAIRNIEPTRALIENRGGRVRSLRRSLTIEQQFEGAWQDAGLNGLSLQPGERGQASQACISVPPGGTIPIGPWDGRTCHGECRQSYYMGPGTFRYVVASCDGTERIAGPPFELPTEPPPGHPAR